MIRREEALDYHSRKPAGKLKIVPTKPSYTQRDLALAYTPGVAEPCKLIAQHPEHAFRFTAKGNLVAVVSNGTAVLGLGNIGALAGKPVMEGKAVLFKRFADIDVFDIEVDASDVETFVTVVRRLEPTFGGINLEDIKAPECFAIEAQLKKQMSIPVFHDDQHGTAIISGAALLNAAELAQKELRELRIAFNGAGAAGISCARHYVHLGVRRENIMICDSLGVVYEGRQEGMNPFKEEFAVKTKARRLAEAFEGVDVFIGLSIGGIVSKEMIQSMAQNPIVFAMANPDPEISYDDARAARDDIIMATGRSDYPNQVNNVLGFPFIFRGALDVRATDINQTMKTAASYALAALAKESVPDAVMEAYDVERLQFGREYFLPKPIDPRVLLWVAPAVAEAAMESGVAQHEIDLEEYRNALEARLGRAREVMRTVIQKAQRRPKRIVYPEGEHEKILRAAHLIRDEAIAHPILLGEEAVIHSKIEELGLNLADVEVVNPSKSPKCQEYAYILYQLRQRKGLTFEDAEQLVLNPNYYGTLMVQTGDADGLISGVAHHYPETLRPALQVIGTEESVKRIAGLYLMVLEQCLFLFADTSVNIESDAEEIAEIALLTAEAARRFDLEPRIAMLSFSNFGSVKHPDAKKMRQAAEIVRAQAPDLVVDGEMQADTAVVPEILHENYPFSALKDRANVLIFPDLQAGNIAYKLLQRLGGAEAIGPILLGMRKPVHMLNFGSTHVKDIVNMTAIAVVDAQQRGPEQEALQLESEPG